MSRIKYLIINLLVITAVFCSCVTRTHAVSSNAGTNTASDFVCRTSEKGDSVEIIGYNGNGGYVAVPEYIGGTPVVSIGDRAFLSNHSISIVFIPDTVTAIGLKAFEDNMALSEITLPYSLKSMGNKAFSGCVSLTSVVIPDGTEHIGDSCFEDCKKLSSVFLPKSVTEIGANCFTGCDGLTVFCYDGSYAQEYCKNKSIVCANIAAASYNPYEHSTESFSSGPYVQSQSVSWYIYFLAGVVVIICVVVFLFTGITTAQGKNILSGVGKNKEHDD